MGFEIVDCVNGKDGVYMLHVHRAGAVHSVREWEVCSELTLGSNKDFTSGDNSDIITTDTQKNTIYLLAKNHDLSTPEEFGLLLCSHYLSKYTHVNRVNIRVEVHPWRRVHVDGEPHEHAFVTSREAVRTCQVRQQRGSTPVVWTGLQGLQLLKTTQTSFVNFVRDEYCSLPDMADRVLSTVVSARWRYGALPRVDFDDTWETVRAIVERLFAGPARGGRHSASLQHTLHLIQVEVLTRLPVVAEIEIVMINKHCFAVDLSKFPKVGSSENDVVFLPQDKPSGNIRAVLSRSNAKL